MGSGIFDQYREGLKSLAGLSAVSARRDRTAVERLARELRGNLADSERDGDTEQRRDERGDILFELTSVVWKGEPRRSFKEICGLGIRYQKWETAEADLSPELRSALFGRITEDESRHLVGREWLFEEIHDRVSRATAGSGSGYVFIQGQPGIGKTAIAAALVWRERWVHHYVIDDVASPEQILRSLCAQLIVTYGLRHEGSLYDEREPSRTLFELLDRAASKPGVRPVVVLLDALDQVADGPGSLHLPRYLPAGTCVVVTSRPLHEAESPHLLKNRKTLNIEDYKSRNDDDLARYIQWFAAVGDSRVRKRIVSSGTDIRSFAGQLTELSAGNFLYARYVLEEIADQLTTADQVGRRLLPDRLRDDGLPGYYRECWNQMHKLADADFARRYEPILAFLALRHRPVPERELMRYTGLGLVDVRHVLSTWRRFFYTTDEGATFFHSSFREFLKTSAELDLELYERRFFGESA